MKIKFLLLGTSLSFIPSLTFAQCVATQDCETLGYTETSCNGGKGVKCPFGNKWACIKSDSEIEQQFCDKYGFQYTCSGTNETGGGEACNNKYAFCTCTSGYYWENGSCQQKAPDYSGCTVGALFYSDNTCSNNLESGKTLLGVVIMERTTTSSGWIMTISPIKTGISWGGWNFDIPLLPNLTSKSNLKDIQASCPNTDAITYYGDSSKYPAAWAAKNYNPIGTPSGKSWCLPSAGLLDNVLNNQTNFDRINTGITTAEGTIIGKVYNDSEGIWSSSEYNSTAGWRFYANTSGLLVMDDDSGKTDHGNNLSVRPVLAF